ncbi:MAG: DUF4058 family protein [Planctomycetes bacterium]|nr:DUF4058 family protein [Planctomycetota bacterium]
MTSIEFLSPSNKLPGDGRDLYQKKREEMMASGVSLVEIDLTRSGERDIIIAPWRLPPSHRTPYLAVVWRSWKPRQREVYAIALEQPLPALRIPLREHDQDVLLELQPLIELCYQNGRHDDLDYKSDPRPPLPSAEAAWAGELLRSGGWR